MIVAEEKREKVRKCVSERKTRGESKFLGFIFVSFGRKMYFCTEEIYVSKFGTCVAEFEIYVSDFET